MKQKHHFIIEKYCPLEKIFDGYMTFQEAHHFMDENATFERRVGYKVYNECTCKWEDFKDSYHGGRKVYDKKGNLFILDPDYNSMWRPNSQKWHLWFIKPDGKHIFCQSFSTFDKANERREFLMAGWKSGTYTVRESDIQISDY